MKITKTYQDYRQDSVFGIITSDQPKIVYVPDDSKFQRCAVGAGESVIMWNLVTGQQVSTFHRASGNGTVSCIWIAGHVTEKSRRLGVGYADGWVTVFDLETGEAEANFRAGRGRVSAINMTYEMLVCAADSEIHILDIVSGSGCRMKGHRGVVTHLKLIRGGDILLSSAQDTFIKMWDLRSHHCFATLTGHAGPVWNFAVSPSLKLLISGTADSQLRVWRLFHSTYDECETTSAPVASLDKPDAVLIPLSEHRALIRAEFLGCVQRSGTRRVHCLDFDTTGTFLVSQSIERNVEVFRILDQNAQVKRLRKKIKKAKETGNSVDQVRLEVSDMLRLVLRVSFPAKISSCAILSARPSWKEGALSEHRLRFVCALKNNSIEEIEAVLPVNGPWKAKTMQVSRIRGQQSCVRLLNEISGSGHRSTPVACSLTTDGLGVFTLSRTEAKLWGRRSGNCLATLHWKIAESKTQESTDPRTEDSNKHLPKRATCFVLAPGDRHVVIGFESGHLVLFDISSKAIRECLSEVHTGAVRGLTLTGDKKGIVSGGSDKQVCFYHFDLKIPESGPPGLCLVQTRPNETAADQITCLAVSPNNRLLVLGLVNFHVDVYFADSFKRVHSLYGHAAPVTSLDISADSRLIITGSGDKTVRLWELQFGNCQRRFTTHMEAITGVCFIPYTSLAMSADMAGLIKQWDISKLREVTTLRGHEGSVTGISAVATNANFVARTLHSTKQSKKGKGRNLGDGSDESDADEFEDLCGGVVASCGRDFSVRVWTESEELLILEEQAELAREAAEDEELVRSEAIIPGALPTEASETGLLGRPTPHTRDAADMLMEAIDIYVEEVAKQELAAQGKPAPPPNPIMVARGTESPERFLLSSLAALRASSSRLGGGGAGLEHALGAITTEHARRLLPRLADWLSKGWEVELVGRAIRHLATLHFALIVTSPELRDVLHQSREARLYTMSEVKSLVGTNLAGLTYLKKKMEENHQTVLFEELLNERDKRIRKQKAKRNKLALLLPG